MFDYLFDLFDGASKVIKFVIISFVFLITCALIVSLYISYEQSEELHSTEYQGTTARRTVPSTKERKSSTTRKKTTTTTHDVISTTTNNDNIIPTTGSPFVPTTSRRTTTNSDNNDERTTKTSTTTTTRTSKNTTKKTTTTRKIALESTTYPNALDFWEWEIVDRINAERKKRGLKELKVAEDLRNLAERAADYWYDHTEEEVAKYIGEHSFYARQLVNASMTASYTYIVDLLIKYTDIETNKYYDYIGAGVIYYDQAADGMRTHFNIIIFE